MAYLRLGHGTRGGSSVEPTLQRRAGRPDAEQPDDEVRREDRREPQGEGRPDEAGPGEGEPREMTQTSGVNPSLYTNQRKPKAPRKPKK